MPSPELAHHRFQPRSAVVLTGPGGNGGGGLVAARHLSNREVTVHIVLSRPATSGRAGVPCVRAAATLILALPKTGLARAPDVVGDLYLADISVPHVLYERMGIEVGPLFADGPVLELRAS